MACSDLLGLNHISCKRQAQRLRRCEAMRSNAKHLIVQGPSNDSDQQLLVTVVHGYS